MFVFCIKPLAFSNFHIIFLGRRRITIISYNIRQINNIDFLSEVSTVHQFVYTEEAFLLVRQ